MLSYHNAINSIRKIEPRVEPDFRMLGLNVPFDEQLQSKTRNFHVIQGYGIHLDNSPSPRAMSVRLDLNVVDS